MYTVRDRSLDEWRGRCKAQVVGVIRCYHATSGLTWPHC